MLFRALSWLGGRLGGLSVETKVNRPGLWLSSQVWRTPSPRYPSVRCDPGLLIVYWEVTRGSPVADFRRKVSLGDWGGGKIGSGTEEQGHPQEPESIGPCSFHTVLIHPPQGRGLWHPGNGGFHLLTPPVMTEGVQASFFRRWDVHD